MPLRASRGQFWVALLCVGVSGAGISAVGAVFPPLARELHISEVTVGVIAGLAPLLFMIAAPVWGHVADRFGPKPVLVAGMTGHTIGAVMFAFSAYAGLSLWLSGYAIIGILIVGRVLNGALGAGIFPAAVSTAAAAVPGERRAAAIASISAAWGIGTMLGPAIATASSAMGLFAPHLILTGLSLAAATLALVVEPPADAPKRAKPGRVLPPTDARIRPFLLITGASYAIIVEINVVFGFSIQDTLQLDPIAAAEVTGMMFTIMGLFSLFAQMLLVRLKRLTPRHAMRIGIAIVLVGLVGLIIADRSILFGLACAAIGLGFGLAGPTASAACSLALSSEEQGSGAGWMSSARSVGSIVGAWSGGMLYAVSPQAPYAASAVVAIGIAALILFHPGTHRSRRI
ncbi:MFS transporter [Thalassobaculum fulvum]|uniref:MFS transporter n=1 Tax=Thalassobaculum fulvum TaxID=1633335 RepID=A0A918XY94_9PROT|nr:MFS transporter [Thalassobaculum fulvum]